MLLGEEEWPASAASKRLSPFLLVLALRSASRKSYSRIFWDAQSKTDTAQNLLELVWSIRYTILLSHASMEPSRDLVVPVLVGGSLDYLIFL
jgi:DNA-binding SARP family transcriptional activator